VDLPTQSDPKKLSVAFFVLEMPPKSNIAQKLNAALTI
jgi:hypothetical protein